LAGDPCNDSVDFPIFCSEGFEIVPNRSEIQGLLDHPCHKTGCRKSVSLDVTNSFGAWESEFKPEIKPADP
jgi:hypothetical protein